MTVAMSALVFLFCLCGTVVVNCGVPVEQCEGTCITGAADCCLFSFCLLPGWELEMGIEEYWGRGWRVNTAGYLCMCVYFLSWSSACHNKPGSHIFPGGIVLFFSIISIISSLMAMIKNLFRGLGTFHCLGRRTHFNRSVCLSIIQPL